MGTADYVEPVVIQWVNLNLEVVQKAGLETTDRH